MRENDDPNELIQDDLGVTMSGPATRKENEIVNESASEYELAHMISPQRRTVKDEN